MTTKAHKYPTAQMDSSCFGNSKRFTYFVPDELLGHVKKGDIVNVVDPGMKSFRAKVIKLLNNGDSAQWERIDN